MGCGHELSIAAHKTGLPSVYAQYQIFCSHYDTICKKSQNLCSKQRIFLLFFYSVARVSPAAGHQLAGYQKKRAQPSFVLVYTVSFVIMIMIFVLLKQQTEKCMLVFLLHLYEAAEPVAQSLGAY